MPSAKLPTPKLITAGAAPKQQASGLGQAISAVGQVSDLGQKAAKAWDVGKTGLKLGQETFQKMTDSGTGKPDIASAPAADLPAGGAKNASFEGGLAPSGNSETASLEGGVMPSSEDLPDLSTMFANRGGLVPGYAAGGAMAPTNPYELNADPLQDVLEDQSKNEIEPLKPAPAPGGGGGSSGLGDAIKVAGQVASLFAMSDARLKDNIEPVGKLYDGQPVYRYDMNGGPTQIGLMAQEAGLRRPDAVGERGGYMTLDYDRATEDAAGLMPRQGFANGGVPGDDLRQIIIEEAERRGIPPDLALRQARTESSFNPNAVGRSGEGGLFQIMPSTARDPGYGVKPADPDELRDPRRNAGFGLDYLKARAERAGLTDWNNPEQVAAGLRAYNGGGDPRYVQKIMGDSAPVAAIDRAAPRGGAPVPPANIGRPEPTGGLSGDGTTSGKPEPKSSGLFSAPNKFGSDQPQGWGNFLTSRQFIVPLLSGIGAAATTPTRNLGTALAAGLGAGAQAYGGLEKQMADVEQTRAQTRGVETDTFKKSVMDTAGGTIIWLTGGVPMLLGDYEKLAREGRAPSPMGRVPDNAEDILKKFREAKAAVSAPGATTPGAPAPGATPGATTPGAPGAPGVSVAPVEKLPLPPPGLNYDKDSQSTAESERSIAFSGGPAAKTAQTITDNYIKVVVPTATAARDSARYLTELAANLSRATQGKGLDAPGFGFDGRAQAVSALNTLSRAFGGKGDFGEADEISEINKKIQTLQAAATAAGGNQESYAALNALKQAIASPNMSPRAYSKLAADLLTQNQRAIDREQHRSMYANDSSGLLSKAAGDFENKNPASKYNEEAEVIQRMILTKPDLIKDLKSGKYTPAQIDEAFEKFGVKGMSRYFVGGR